ncbi:MAG: NAD(+) synthase, partial [Clostridia bacterium]|nr:NAD(+) synthase [Clostridia bacterium]
GDHMSMYGVNAGVPKTLMKTLTRCEGERLGGEAKRVIEDVLHTAVSPELLPTKNGEIAQKTEDTVGPYELHDFFLYHTLKNGASPKKLLYLAEHAFFGEYSRARIKEVLAVFIRRFFGQQFKRNCLPDGVKSALFRSLPGENSKCPQTLFVRCG